VAAVEVLANAEAAAAPLMTQRVALERAADRLCRTGWDWMVAGGMGEPPALLATGHREKP
jgi:hypothetical protein